MSDSRDLGEGESDGSAAPPSALATLEPPAAARAQAASSRSGLVMFFVASVLTVLSLGAPILLISGAARWDAQTATPTSAAFPRATSVPTQAASAPAAVRVVSATGSAESAGGAAYRVTFTWVLDGARGGDPAVVRFFVGSRLASEQRGVLDSGTFTAASGRFQIATSQECSTDGWSAELVSLRSQPLLGDATIKVAGATCR